MKTINEAACEYEYRLDDETPAYKRVSFAGFDIIDFESGYNLKKSYWWVRISLMCVCGRELHELMQVTTHSKLAPYLRGDKFDAALYLEARGALSVEHLRHDGFNEEEIAYIRRAYDNPQLLESIAL